MITESQVIESLDVAFNIGFICGLSISFFISLIYSYFLSPILLPFLRLKLLLLKRKHRGQI